jgi:hypothetical protein
MSQSLVNESSGARTPLSGLIAAIFTLIVVVFASGLLRNPPQPALAAIVLAAVMGLVDVAALRHIWHFSFNGDVRDALRRIDFEREHGPIDATHTVAAVVTAWQDSSR